MIFKNSSTERELNRKIDELTEENSRLADDVRYWKGVHEREYEEIQQLKDKLETVEVLLKNLPSHQLPKLELPTEYYKSIVYNKVKAFTALKDIGFGEKGDYILLCDSDSDRTQLVRVKEKVKVKIGSTFRVFEDLGFKSQNLCDRDLKFTYPEAEEEKTPIFVYYVEKMK